MSFWLELIYTSNFFNSGWMRPLYWNAEPYCL
jgi:hypothetical protein